MATTPAAAKKTNPAAAKPAPADTLDGPHSECVPVGGLPAGATSFACEHGSWTFEPVPADPPAAVDLDELLAGVDTEKLRAALATREGTSDQAAAQ